MVRLFFATSMKFIRHQHFFLSLVTGSDDSEECLSGLKDRLPARTLRWMKQNISKAESRERWAQAFSHI